MRGYYRFPTIFKDQIVFVSEDDLWIAKADNLDAKRLTSNLAPITSPLFSANGKWIAYVGRDDGNTEVSLLKKVIF